MEQTLKVGKGWIRQISGNEYVYDFHLAKMPVIVKVMSSIQVDTDRVRNRGSDAIRVFAVEKDSMSSDPMHYNVLSGLVKAIIVYRTINWRDNLENAVMAVMHRAKIHYIAYRQGKRIKSPEK